MKKIILSLLIIIAASSIFIACTLPDDDSVTCEEMMEELQQLKITIEEYAATSTCGEEFECLFIAFGSKPCGGPWEYLIYSTSIDTDQLVTLVNDYNQLENDYNEICGAISDCSIPNEPVGFTCENNQCIPVF